LDPRRRLADVVDVILFGRLARRQQTIDRRDPSLEPQPRSELLGRRIGDGNRELMHPLLEPPSVPALDPRHLLEQLRLVLREAARDQLIRGLSDDLPTPRLEKPLANLGAAVSIGVTHHGCDPILAQTDGFVIARRVCSQANELWLCAPGEATRPGKRQA
jgi:hypothetical protein